MDTNLISNTLYLFLFIYLATPGLSCRTWELHWGMWGSVLVTRDQTWDPSVRSKES